MEIKVHMNLMVTDEYYQWYRTETPTEGRREYLRVGEVVKTVLSDDVDPGEWEFKTLDNRVCAIAPVHIIQQMRLAYLRRKKEAQP